MNDYNPYSLLGKTILVTGASSGIGRAVATECSKLGAIVVVTGRDEDRLNQTFTMLTPNAHKKCIADISDESSLFNLVNNCPALNGLVLCAGYTKTIPFQYANKKIVNDLFDVNLFGGIELVRLLLKFKKIGHGTSVVFISSISGNLCGILGNSIYSAAKGAINGIAKNLALELSSKYIRVNTVQPGMIDTHILKDEVFTDEQIELDKKRYPLKRYGKPEEVAYAVIYLLSDASAWTTGSNLLIDGGYTLQ